MSAYAHSPNAYGNATRALGTPRTIEYQVFSQVTGALTRASRPGQPYTALVAALYDNLRLWTAIAADVMHHDNGLPDGLRAQLVSLSAFQRSHTERVLNDAADPGVLIDINTAIMRGLRGVQAGVEA